MVDVKIHLKQQFYLFNSLPFLQTHYTLDDILELAQALYGKETLSFSECLYHVMKYVKCSKPHELKALYEFIQTSNDKKLNTIPVELLLVILYQHTFAPIDSDSKETNVIKDYYACYQFYACQWKEKFKEFSSIFSLYMNGPGYLEEFKESKTLLIPFTVFEKTMSLLFYAKSSEINSRFNSNPKDLFLNLYKEWNKDDFVSKTKENRIDADKASSFLNAHLNMDIPDSNECIFSENGFCIGLARETPNIVPVFISGQSHSVLVLDDSIISNESTIVLDGLFHSHVYILACIENLLIVNCFNTHIYVGAVSKHSNITHCHSLSVSLASSQVSLVDTHDLFLYSFTEHPLMLLNCHEIKLAPCNFSFEYHLECIDKAKLDIDQENHWSSVMPLPTNPNQEQENMTCFKELDPKDFVIKDLAFSRNSFKKLSKKTLKTLPLPKEYKEANEFYLNMITKFKRLISTSNTQMQSDFGSQMQENMLNWIENQGNLPLYYKYIGLSAESQEKTLKELDKS